MFLVLGLATFILKEEIQSYAILQYERRNHLKKIKVHNARGTSTNFETLSAPMLDIWQLHAHTT